ncbi:MAG: tRNA 2-thiouridine(34) synthase TusC [Moraxellaceae bacterium]|jgi:tRNA 2-thiouridine synthesizing protein C|nr:tRNA 2-thiouridine(34) synthase TusC [Moraxellaceae bacterium]
MKRTLFIQHRAPYGSESPQEQVDAQLVAATFGLRVSVLFQDDGVWQLLSQQDGKQLERRTLGAQLQALGLYDIQNFYVDAASLDERGLRAETLSLPVKVLDAPGLQALLAEHDLVLRF